MEDKKSFLQEMFEKYNITPTTKLPSYKELKIKEEEIINKMLNVFIDELKKDLRNKKYTHTFHPDPDRRQCFMTFSISMWQDDGKWQTA